MIQEQSKPSKACSRCGVIQPIAEFHAHPTNKDGRQALCRSCMRIAKRKGTKTRAELRAEVFPDEKSKRCSKCHEVKPLSEYGRRNERPGSQVRAECKECQGIAYRTWANKAGRMRAKRFTIDEGGAIVWKKSSIDLRFERRPNLLEAKCKCCGRTLPLEQFHKSSQTGGFRHICSDCRNEAEAIRYERTKEHFAKRRREYKTTNSEKVREWSRQGEERRRARKAAVECTLTDSEWALVLEAYGNRCLRCGATQDLTIDHVVPISAGGPHSLDNVQPLCKPCNSKKHTKTVDYRPFRIGTHTPSGKDGPFGALEDPQNDLSF